MKITIYNPSIRQGGTNNLLANLAVLLSSYDQFDVYYIEYINGATIKFVSDHAPQCKIVTIGINENVLVTDGLLILILLHAKLLSDRIVLSDIVRLLLWSTHPEDGIKIIPTFNLFYKKSEPIRSLIADFISPFQKKRTRKFINAGIKEKGIVWMDLHNYKSNDTFYNLSNEPVQIWPITTSAPTRYKKPFKGNSNDISIVNIVVLGRLCDFKTIPILTLLDNILELRSKINLNFVGTGDYEPLLKQKLNELGYSYRFVGETPKDKLDSVLIQYDVLIGMGTSVLEGAKLGIPSIVMNGSYKKNVPASILFEWVQDCPSGFLGEIVSSGSTLIMKKSLEELLLDYITNKESLSEKSFQCWNETYSSKALLALATRTINENTFYYGENKKHLKLTVLNKVVNWLKQKLIT